MTSTAFTPNTPGAARPVPGLGEYVRPMNFDDLRPYGISAFAVLEPRTADGILVAVDEQLDAATREDVVDQVLTALCRDAKGFGLVRGELPGGAR